MLQSRGESLREEGVDEEAEAQETLLQVKGGRAETILTRQTKKSYWTRLRNKLCTAHRFKNLQVSSSIIKYGILYRGVVNSPVTPQNIFNKLRLQ